MHDGDVLVIRRSHRFACVVNCGAHPQASAVIGDLLVSSGGRDSQGMVEGGRLLLPPSTGVWMLT